MSPSSEARHPGYLIHPFRTDVSVLSMPFVVGLELGASELP